MKCKIVDVRKAPPGFSEDVLGLVTFDFQPDSFEANLTITKYTPPAENAPAGTQGKTYDRFKFACAPGSTVRVFDAQIRRSKPKAGEAARPPYLAVQDLELSRELRNEVCYLAMERLDTDADEASRKNPQRAAAGPRPFTDDIPF